MRALLKVAYASVVVGIYAASHAAIASNHVDDTKNSNMSPEGYWLQFSDHNDKAQSVFQIRKDQNGKLEGSIVVPFFRIENGEVAPPNVHCQKCGKGSDNGYTYDYTQMPDSRVQGMKILWGFAKIEKKVSVKPTDGYEWDDGTILDPESGHLYSAYLYTRDSGKELFLRGYWGISLIGRTQLWKRISKKDADHWVKTCGLSSDGTHYTYTNKSGRISDQKLWQTCSNIEYKASS